MALLRIPSSFECVCGHVSHFFENTVREMEALSKRSRKPQRLLASESAEHAIEFDAGNAAAVICPARGRCEITGWV